MGGHPRGASVSQILRVVACTAPDDVELAVRLHDTVRDRVKFGFTPYFDAASPDVTLRLGVGHCNPQAALMVDLFRAAGFEARFQPVTISNDVLRGVALTPRLLSHVFTEVKINGRWCRLDSYIVDPPLREAAVGQLRAEGRKLGYGCHVEASDWDGRSDAFSQIATPDLVLEEHEPVRHIEDFYRSSDYLHAAGGMRYTTLLAPLRAASGATSKLINRPIEELRRAGFRGVGR